MGEVERFSGLADKINAEHRACEAAAGTALEHAIRAGEMLAEVRADLPHGSWGSWIGANFGGSARTAQAYMRLYRRRGEIRNGAADLSVRGALAALSAPKDEARLDRPATLEALEAKAEGALSQARAGALGIAESLDAIYRGRGWESLGYASFADYVTAEFGAPERTFPIPYAVISDQAGEPLPVFAMAESIHAWGAARAVGSLIRGQEV